MDEIINSNTASPKNSSLSLFLSPIPLFSFKKDLWVKAPVSYTHLDVYKRQGETRDLEELAKLWHLLVNDPKLEKVQLKSLSKGTGSVSFVFEAHIILDEFILLAEI